MGMHGRSAGLLFSLALGAVVLTPNQVCAYSKQEIHACFDDAVQICGAKPSISSPSFFEKLRVGLCMLAHKAELTPACRKVIKDHGF